MTADQWISLAAVVVTGVTVVVAGFVTPWVSARRERDHRISDKRSEVYTDALTLLRARFQETQDAATYGTAKPAPGEPTKAELERVLTQVLLYAPKPFRKKFEESVQEYSRSMRHRLAADSARRKGTGDMTARNELGKAAERLGGLLEETTALMRKDIGTHRR